MAREKELDPARQRLVWLLEDHPAISMKAASKRAGKADTYVRDFLKGSPVELPERVRERLGETFGVPPDYFRPEYKGPRMRPNGGDSSHQKPSSGAPLASSMLSSETSNRRRGNIVGPYGAGYSEEADLPVKGFLRQGEHGYFYDQGTTADLISRPVELRGVDDAYAMQLVDDSMAPLQAGWYVTFNPHKPPRAGDLVAVYLDDGESLFKRLDKITEAEVILKQTNPVKTLRFKKSRVTHIHRFVTIHSERP
jgi:phage repressor protein C with HTH and peptisase S24 domain